VFFSGTTVSFLRATPVEDARSSITDRYERTIETVQQALSDLGVDTMRGEPEGAFCPGTHSLSVGGKVVGLAQRVTDDVATVAAVLVVTDAAAVRSVLEPVYAALDVPFDPASVGSLTAAGAVENLEVVCGAIRDRVVPGVRET
jgi:lipoate-protein ligase A